MKKAGNAVYFRDFDTFLECQIRKYGRETSGKHGLSASGMAAEKYVVISGGGDLHGSFDKALSPYVGEIRPHGKPSVFKNFVYVYNMPFGGFAFYDLRDVFKCIYVHTLDKSGLIGIVRRNDAFFYSFLQSPVNNGQNAADGSYAAVKGELAENETVVEFFGIYPVQRGKDADRYGKIEGRAFLFCIGRSEIDGYAVWRELAARVFTAVRTLSLDSLTAEPGRPTISKQGSPLEMSTSTLTI